MDVADKQFRSMLERLIIETEDKIDEYRVKKAEAESELVHVRAAILILEKHRSFGSSAPTMSVARLFGRGEIFARCVQFLQEDGPELTTSELAARLLLAKNLNGSDKHLHRSMTQLVIVVLSLRRAQGEIVSPGKRGVVCVWRLPDDTQRAA